MQTKVENNKISITKITVISALSLTWSDALDVSEEKTVII